MNNGPCKPHIALHGRTPENSRFWRVFYRDMRTGTIYPPLDAPFKHRRNVTAKANGFVTRLNSLRFLEDRGFKVAA